MTLPTLVFAALLVALAAAWSGLAISKKSTEVAKRAERAVSIAQAAERRADAARRLACEVLRETRSGFGVYRDDEASRVCQLEQPS